MSAEEALAESDRAPGAPHPRETSALFGQDAAEADFLEAVASGRLHHGWLISGPRGIGKATLAWRMARFLLATPEPQGGGLFAEAPAAPTSLDVAPDHPVARRVVALAEPRLHLLRIAWDTDRKRFKSAITVDEVRKLKSFFQMSAADGGRRVVIVDAADDLNTAAANALLKVLEEPPRGAHLLLVAHQPARLLPTIRSRCRELRCQPLGPQDLSRALQAAGFDAGAQDADAIAALSGGSVGRAIALADLGGAEIYGQLVQLLAAAPRMDRAAAIALAETAGARGQEARFRLVVDLIDLALSRLARSGVSGPPEPQAAENEAQVFARLCPGPAAAREWAALQQQLGARARQGQSVNLDPAALILDTLLRINEAAAKLAA